MMNAWHRYWFSPAPCLDLAVLRIVACGLQLFWLLYYGDFYVLMSQRAALPDLQYEPLPILNALHLPFGWGYRPSFEVLQVLFAVNLVAGGFALVGLFTNPSLVVFAVISVYLQAFLYSFGDFHHPEAVLMVTLSVLALSPSGRVLSLDWWLRRRREGAALPILKEQSAFAGWPIKLIGWFFALMYISAVWSKLSASGLDWANGYTLQYSLARDSMLWGASLGLWLSQFHILVMLGQIGVLLFQATFSLAVIFPRLRWLYVPAGLALHAMILLTLSAPFITWIALYVVFIPWSVALRLARERLGASELDPIAAGRRS